MQHFRLVNWWIGGFVFLLSQTGYMDMSQKVKFSDLFSFSITGQDILKLFTSQNKRGCNPLMTAAEFESNDVLQFLLNFLKGFVISKGIFNLVGSIIKKWTKTLFFNCLLLTTEPPKIRDLRNRSLFYEILFTVFPCIVSAETILFWKWKMWKFSYRFAL